MPKHEGVHLELLARLFERTGYEDLSRWIQSEPGGKCARRAGFLYERLTGRTLDFDGVRTKGYVEALDHRDALEAV